MTTVDELREQLRQFQQHLQLKDNIPNWFTLRLKTLQSRNITLEDWNTTLSYLQTVVSDIVSEQEFLNTLTSYLILVLNDLIRFNQLVEDVRNLERNSASAISSSQNINADGIQYTITLSNTQNANLSTTTQYIPLATTLQAGLLSSADKEKLNNLESNLTTYLVNAKAYTDEKLERDNLVSILGTASYTLDGLLTAEDKKKIDALYSLLGEQEDADTVVNTINEVLAIFSNYPEGVNIISEIEKKVNYSDVINTLDSEEISKPLSAKMGKELKTKVDTKAELAYVNEELNKKALQSDLVEISTKFAINNSLTTINITLVNNLDTTYTNLITDLDAIVPNNISQGFLSGLNFKTGSSKIIATINNRSQFNLYILIDGFIEYPTRTGNNYSINLNKNMTYNSVFMCDGLNLYWFIKEIEV